MAGDVIEVNIGELEDAANKFKIQADTIETAANNSDKAIDYLRQMKSDRIYTIVEVWDDLLKSLRMQIENFKSIADEQVSAANDFNNANKSRFK